MKLDSPFLFCMKTNSKCLKDFNVRPKTLNLLQEKKYFKLSNREGLLE